MTGQIGILKRHAFSMHKALPGKFEGDSAAGRWGYSIVSMCLEALFSYNRNRHVNPKF